MSVRAERPYGYERALTEAGLGPVAGADEAGRGACAGPLVAAAVILDDSPAGLIGSLDDSKRLTARARERLYEEITARALAWSCVRVEADECDRLGMAEADLQGLRRALLRLDPGPRFALIDGFEVPGLPVPGLGMWKGDRVCACVSAASIIAKVTRDRIMVGYDEQYPAYGFATHKGYVTALHRERLERLGPCAIHRLGYANVRAAARLVQS